MSTNPLNSFITILEQIKKQMEGIHNSQNINEPFEKQVHQNLDNAITQLQSNPQWLNLLAIKQESDVGEFYDWLHVKSSPSGWHEYWGAWAYELGCFIDEFKGEYTFNKKYMKNGQTYNLKGKNLILTRTLSSNKSLPMVLHNVGTVHISVPSKSGIHVEVKDQSNKKIATWEEYKQTEKIALVRENSGDYRFEFIK